MIEFVVRARKAPTDPDRFLGTAGAEVHVEYLTQILINGLFISKGHRDDVRLSFVFEGSLDFSRIITFESASLGSLGDRSENGLMSLFADCLKKSVGQAKDTTTEVMQGVTVSTSSFETLIKQYQMDDQTDDQTSRQIYLLDKKGTDIREQVLEEDAVFVLTDHIPMPTKQAKSLVNRGAKKVSLGPKMLHASQCVVLIQNEYDRLN